MGISSSSDYVKFFLSLNMGDGVSLISFVNNEKMVIKSKLDNKNMNRERLLKGLEILDGIAEEINTIGEKGVLEKYGK